ncbi:hypothetical protein JNJ66_06240 [Candidatus Saccharibacteria bacterium]|nr:hypothetical protein [Candidatus Saccharibacteria bacterium]
MSSYKKTQSSQAGFVSLFSVVFFTLLASVITIGFIRIMNREQRQALDNDLTSRALAAAEAGVEDAKRAILKYTQLPNGTERDAYRAALTGQACDTLFGAGSPVRTSIGLGGQEGGTVSPTDQQNLRYNCLNVRLDTADYISSLAANESQIIPLRSTGAYNQVKVQWHRNSSSIDSDSDGIANPSNVNPLNPTVQQFNTSGANGQQPPAYMRLQVFGLPKSGNFNNAALEQRNFTLFGVPVQGPLNTTVTANVADPRGFNMSKSSPIRTNCMNAAQSAANSGNYACQMTVTLPGGALDTANNNYYLRVTPLYRKTHFRLSLMNNGTNVNFNEVQPSIDSTGSAADVFRRVEVRTTFPEQLPTPPRYLMEVGDSVCKDFFVTDNPANFLPTSPECYGK